MSLFGKILAVVNVFAVIGVLALLGMNYARNRAWQYKHNRGSTARFCRVDESAERREAYIDYSSVRKLTG